MSPFPEKKPAVELHNVSFSYGADWVLEEVDLAILDGDFVALVGPNGGGKTTLLRLILGLLRPSRGTIRVYGEGPASQRKRIGYIPQRHELDPQFPATVMDVVLMGRLGLGLSWGFHHRGDRPAAEKALEEVHLLDARNELFRDLSGGQQQRALIARALACDPHLLLLDEPTANLDVHMEGALYALLSEINQRMTVVLVSHDLGVVSNLVRTVVCVNRHIAVHPTSELTGDRLSEVYGDSIRMVRHDHSSHGEGAHR